MWFKKTRQQLNDLQNKINQVDKEYCKQVENLRQENEKLHRIIKFAGDKPTFRLDCHKTRLGIYGYISKNTLYIYCDKEEYHIELGELKDGNIDKSSYEFKVEGDLAYLNFYYHDYGWYRYEYVIDYKRGTYVCNYKIDNERDSKEEPVTEDVEC